jgi:hypothetical protein
MNSRSEPADGQDIGTGYTKSHTGHILLRPETMRRRDGKEPHLPTLIAANIKREENVGGLELAAFPRSCLVGFY